MYPPLCGLGAPIGFFTVRHALREHTRRLLNRPALAPVTQGSARLHCCRAAIPHCLPHE
ncbi:hypothetical protein [Bradyrhizobium sp. DOA9]|uniref:hypothetical protein n=1 Tax=Bradyrhizobium sp. DOA9 TaxID=1126627 RepID=UPI001260178D